MPRAAAALERQATGRPWLAWLWLLVVLAIAAHQWRFWHDSRLLSTQGLGHNRIADDQGVIDAALRFLRGETVGERVVSSPNLPYGFA